ncbi:hypothetical protein PO909_015089 [Leuciscus waleckii]
MAGTLPVSSFSSSSFSPSSPSPQWRSSTSCWTADASPRPKPFVTCAASTKRWFSCNHGDSGHGLQRNHNSRLVEKAANSDRALRHNGVL